MLLPHVSEADQKTVSRKKKEFVISIKLKLTRSSQIVINSELQYHYFEKKM